MDALSQNRTRASLLARLGHNPADGAAWDHFVELYGPKIYDWCRRWGLQDADAQDVCQDVLLKVSRRIQTFTYDPARSFRSWLKKLAHDAWCDWLASHQPHDRGTGANHGLDLLASAEARTDLLQRLEDQFDAELLEEASARVRLQVEPKTWEAFRLLMVEQVSGAEAAQRLGMKVGAVYVAKSRVRKLLQEEVRILDPEETSP